MNAGFLSCEMPEIGPNSLQTLPALKCGEANSGSAVLLAGIAVREWHWGRGGVVAPPTGAQHMGWSPPPERSLVFSPETRMKA